MDTTITAEEVEQMLDGRVIRRPVRPGSEDELVVFRDGNRAIRLTVRKDSRRLKAQAATGKGDGSENVP